MTNNTNLIWFRNDLRILNNPAVYEACKNARDKVLALYIATPKQWKQHYMAPKQALFIYKNILYLEEELIKFNINLYYCQVNTFYDSIPFIIKFSIKHNINKIFYNYEYPINEKNRDSFLKKILYQKKILMYGFHGNMLISPYSVLNTKCKPYKKYYAFKNNIIQKLSQLKLKNDFFFRKESLNNIKISKIYPFNYPMEEFNKNMFPVGEKNAMYRLKMFCKNKMNNYSKNRNFPSLHGTSLLSVYLSIGILSPIQCLYAILKHQPNLFFLKEKCIWLDEIIWREFYYYLTTFYPFLSKNRSVLQWTEQIPWKNDIRHLNAWKSGQTGFPIIDAAMRQLNKLGWMHNRLRMITASFLVKNLLIDWNLGQKYFMLKLIDGNFASNNGGWQWVASTGFDSLPYFRIFNPTLQSKKFDFSGNFIRTYIPELKKVPNSYIHEPHRWIDKQNYNINYPSPIVNYISSSKKALSIFNSTRNLTLKYHE